MGGPGPRLPCRQAKIFHKTKKITHVHRSSKCLLVPSHRYSRVATATAAIKQTSNIATTHALGLYVDFHSPRLQHRSRCAFKLHPRPSIAIFSTHDHLPLSKPKISPPLSFELHLESIPISSPLQLPHRTTLDTLPHTEGEVRQVPQRCIGAYKPP